MTGTRLDIPDITAWHPNVAGIDEVFHARFAAHAYPPHTHDAWTLLIIDDGLVCYHLARHDYVATSTQVTLLPPGVPHDGRSARPEGFRKRVLYLDRAVLGEQLVSAAVDHPSLPDPLLRKRIHQLHQTLSRRTDDLEAASRLAFVAERLATHLDHDTRSERKPGRGKAGELRELLDASLPHGIPLDHAAAQLDTHPTALIRAFSREFGIPPHRYLIARRLELARSHLLAGHPPAQAATLAGFYDQAHLTRHFTRLLGIGPARYVHDR
jgi:AraC-like DNA-binding protein